MKTVPIPVVQLSNPYEDYNHPRGRQTNTAMTQQVSRMPSLKEFSAHEDNTLDGIEDIAPEVLARKKVVKKKIIKKIIKRKNADGTDAPPEV